MIYKEDDEIIYTPLSHALGRKKDKTGGYCSSEDETSSPLPSENHSYKKVNALWSAYKSHFIAQTQQGVERWPKQDDMVLMRHKNSLLV